LEGFWSESVTVSFSTTIYSASSTIQREEREEAQEDNQGGRIKGKRVYGIKA
jgi:hypothetical protein